MSAYSNRVLEVCNSRYQEVYGVYAGKSSDKIVVSHFGEFTQELVNSISNGVEEMMLNSGDKKGIVKRMFSILVEGLQNIRIHGEKDLDGNQTSFLVVGQSDNSYKLCIANLVYNKNIESIDNRIEEINKHNAVDVKSLYMEVLTNGVISNKGGAGLGFITMAMKSKNNLGYQFERIDERYSCFSLEVTLERKKKEE